jgi:hypothetical protein
MGLGQNKAIMQEIVHETTKDGLTLQIVFDEADEAGENATVVMGGLNISLLWPEYLDRVIAADLRPHVELIRQAVEEIGWIGKTGGEICNYHQFKFSDGVEIGFTWRAWGDFMQAIVGKREGYMAYYC